MCTLYDRITELCKAKGVSGSRMCLDLGLSKSTLSDIKNGRKKGISTSTAQKMAAYLGVSVGYLLGNDEDSRALEKAKSELTEFVNSNSSAVSGERLDVLFNVSGYDHVIVCFNLGIEQYYLDNWMDNNDLPPKPIVDKILGVFRLKPEDLLSSNELADYNSEAQEWVTKEKAPAESGKRSVSDDDIKFALFGGDGEITDAMYQEVKEFAALIKLREDMKKSKE